MNTLISRKRGTIMTSTTDILEDIIIDYRVKCDMAVSERDDDVFTQEQYEKAINRCLNYTTQQILSNLKQSIERAKPLVKIPLEEVENTPARELSARAFGADEALDQFESNLYKELGIE